MPMYVYHADGHSVGFLSGTIIHDLAGEPLGRILGSHVYRLDGSYVGEWFKDMVVAKPIETTKRAIAAVPAPPRLPSPGPGFCRRGVINYGYADVFHELYPQGHANDDMFAHAAE